MGCHSAEGSPTGGGRTTVPGRLGLAGSDRRFGRPAPIPRAPLERGPRAPARPWLSLRSPFPVPGVRSPAQRLPANAAQVDETVAAPESLKKLLIIWLMCTGLWECEINHQPRDELLKWVLVFRLLSLGHGFSSPRHQASRCRDAVFSFSQSQEQPVARRCLFPGPAA